MPKYIPADFQPTDKTYSFLLKKHQIPRDFLDEYVTDHFINFWNELKEEKLAKGKKSAWQTTYITWAKRAWRGLLGREYEDKRHKNRQLGGPRENLFEDTLADLQGEKKPKKKSPQPRPVHRKPAEPAPGPAMTAEQAFDQLRREGHIK
jgi:hypothetical protein